MMIRSRKVLSVMRITMAFAIVLAVGAFEPVSAEEHAMPRVKPPAAFERLAKLVGKWEGTKESSPDTDKIAVEYALTSAGTAMMEKLFPGTAHEMLTIYHGDKDSLMMTHYCALGNQPRMRSEKTGEPNVIKFVFSDGTSLTSADDPHMHQLTITFVDDNHMVHEWVFFAGGKQQAVERFDFHRKR